MGEVVPTEARFESATRPAEVASPHRPSHLACVSRLRRKVYGVHFAMPARGDAPDGTWAAPKQLRVPAGTGGRGPMSTQNTLRGRDAECAVLDHLLAAVRGGESRALALRGEPGAGKTALLDYAIGTAQDFRVLRAVGVESEMELPFASLQQMCAPMLDRLDRIPGPRQDALRVAFGLSAGVAPDRFLVGVAALGLVSELAEEQPLLCVIDDAQWLDRRRPRHWRSWRIGWSRSQLRSCSRRGRPSTRSARFPS